MIFDLLQNVLIEQHLTQHKNGLVTNVKSFGFSHDFLLQVDIKIAVLSLVRFLRNEKKLLQKFKKKQMN